jgi:hypothetical protein
MSMERHDEISPHFRRHQEHEHPRRTGRPTGKPIAESNALCIPTASYGHPMGGPGAAWQFITGRATTPMCELGWNSLGVLELTALPSIDEEQWLPLVEVGRRAVGAGVRH